MLEGFEFDGIKIILSYHTVSIVKLDRFEYKALCQKLLLIVYGETLDLG